MGLDLRWTLVGSTLTSRSPPLCSAPLGFALRYATLSSFALPCSDLLSPLPLSTLCIPFSAPRFFLVLQLARPLSSPLFFFSALLDLCATPFYSAPLQSSPLHSACMHRACKHEITHRTPHHTTQQTPDVRRDNSIMFFFLCWLIWRSWCAFRVSHVKIEHHM